MALIGRARRRAASPHPPSRSALGMAALLGGLGLMFLLTGLGLVWVSRAQSEQVKAPALRPATGRLDDPIVPGRNPGLRPTKRRGLEALAVSACVRGP